MNKNLQKLDAIISSLIVLLILTVVFFRKDISALSYCAGTYFALGTLEKIRHLIIDYHEVNND